MDITQLVTGGGVVLLLASLIGYLLNANWRDRTQQQDVLTGLRNQIKDLVDKYEERLTRQAEQYEKRLVEMEARYEAKIEHLGKRVDVLEEEVDGERRLRITAEIENAQLRSENAQLKSEITLLKAQRRTGA